MRKLLLPLAAPLLLAACAAPLPFQIASWAIDGISYLSTGKSVADHGISLIAQKDCALWRSVKGEAVCIDPVADDLVVVAQAGTDTDDGETDLVVDPIEIAAAVESVEAPKSSDPGPAGTEPFEAPAPVPVSVLVAQREAPIEAPVLTIGTVVSDDDIQVASLAVEALPLAAITPAAGPTKVPATVPAGPILEDDLSMMIKVVLKTIPDEAARPRPPAKDFYYVIGSFLGAANARFLAAEQASFGAQVVVGTGGDGRLRHRVVVGPLPKHRRPAMRRRIVAAGIADVWAIRLAAPAIVARADGLSGNG